MTRELALATLVILSGGFGTWLLLPHRMGRAKPRMIQGFGAALAVLALLLLAMFYTPPSGFLQSAFFYAFATAAVGGGILTISSRNPVYSALWFASVVLSTSGLFLLAGAQFLAAGTIIVYAGAIIVTFLFVIMLAQSEGHAVYDRMARAPGAATLSGFGLLWAVFYALVMVGTSARPTPTSGGVDPLVRGSTLVMRSRPGDRGIVGRVRPGSGPAIILAKAIPATAEIPREVPPALGVSPPHVAALGGTLFTDHIVAVELAGTLLFAGLVGAIAIAAPKPPTRPANRSALTIAEPARAVAPSN